MLTEVIIKKIDPELIMDTIKGSVEIPPENVNWWSDDPKTKDLDIVIMGVNGYKVPVNSDNNKIIFPIRSGPIYSTEKENDIIELLKAGKPDSLLYAEGSKIYDNTCEELTRVANNLRKWIDEGFMVKSMYDREMI